MFAVYLDLKSIIVISFIRLWYDLFLKVHFSRISESHHNEKSLVGCMKYRIIEADWPVPRFEKSDINLMKLSLYKKAFLWNSLIKGRTRTSAYLEMASLALWIKSSFTLKGHIEQFGLDCAASFLINDLNFSMSTLSSITQSMLFIF